MKQFVILFLSSILFACSGGNSVEEALDTSDPIVSELTPERVEKVQEVFFTIPSPMEFANLFYSSGVEYRAINTNAADNVNDYDTSSKKALNLGVYGADLSYANVFDQSQESMIYIHCVKKLSDDLNVSAAFEIETIERIEESVNNRDSLMVIVDDAFKVVEAHLIENGQAHLSTLIIAGGWVEGLYLGTRNLDKENPNLELMERIAKQKSALSSLMELLITYDNTEISALEQKMKEIQTAYKKVDINAVDPQVIFEISDAVVRVRSDFVQ